MVMSPQASCTREATRPSLGKAKSTSMPNVYAFLEVTTTGDDRCAYPSAMRPAGAGGGCEILGLAASQYRSTALRD